VIYFCADDYGLCTDATTHIQECIDRGVLNKVAVFPNFDKVDLQKISKNKNVRLSLHLNLVEGRCLSDPGAINMLADKDGNFIHDFGGLFINGLLHGKKLEAQLYEEIRAQIAFWKSSLPADTPFCIDSHQHTHMIPAVFRALLRALTDEEIELEYMRIPSEPFLPYITTPSLCFTYSPINLIKQWLLKFLWMLNKRRAKKHGISESYFFGILFSGKMDEKRVLKILPKYKKLAEKNGKDIEVLFHPGYTCKSHLSGRNIVFEDFYLSPNRKTEFDSAIKIQERSAL